MKGTNLEIAVVEDQKVKKLATTIPPCHENQIKKKKKRRKKKKTVRTLYISGLPADVKAREVYLMFGNFTGYQGSILLTRSEGDKKFPVAFVTFDDREHAKIAESALHGKQFDPEHANTMNIEFAKQDTKNDKFTNSSSLVIQKKPSPPPDPYRTNIETRSPDSNICTNPYAALQLPMMANPTGTQMMNWDYNYYTGFPFLQPYYMGMYPPVCPGMVYTAPVVDTTQASQAAAVL